MRRQQCGWSHTHEETSTDRLLHWLLFTAKPSWGGKWDFARCTPTSCTSWFKNTRLTTLLLQLTGGAITVRFWWQPCRHLFRFSYVLFTKNLCWPLVCRVCVPKPEICWWNVLFKPYKSEFIILDQPRCPQLQKQAHDLTSDEKS